MNSVPDIELIDHEEIIVLAHRPHLAMALDETLTKVGIDEHHVMAIEVEPLLISLGVLGSLEPQLHSAARPLLYFRGKYNRLRDDAESEPAWPLALEY